MAIDLYVERATVSFGGIELFEERVVVPPRYKSYFKKRFDMSIGVTRNITAIFQRYRDARRQAGRPFSIPSAQQEQGSRLIAAALDCRSDGVAIDIPSTRPSSLASCLPPAWVDVSEEVGNDMAKIKEKMAELSKVHARAMLVTFGDSADDESSVEVLTQEITRLFKRAEARLRKLPVNDGTSSQDEEKVRKNVQISMATDLQKLSMDFRKQQKEFLQKMQKQKGPDNTRDLLDMNLGGGDAEPFDPGFSDAQLQRTETSAMLAQERDQEVTQIVQSVNDLAQVMKDLSVLVIDQGTVLDCIDYNCEKVRTDIEQGLQEVIKAEESQKKSRMVMCIMLLAVMVVFMTIVVIIKKLAGF